MAEFLTTSNIASEITNVVRRAKQHLALVSPYLQFSDNFIQRLRDADCRGVKILIVYKENHLGDDEKKVLSSLSNLHLYACPNLHAKCYCNEERMVITSMNLYEYSEKNNREMGVLVTADEEVYQEAISEVKSIVDHAKETSVHSFTMDNFLSMVSGNTDAATSNDRISEPKTSGYSAGFNGGHCIRCSDSVKHNPERPFCRECYKTWAAWENPDFEEKVCHSCGSETNSSMRKPQCYGCYTNMKAAGGLLST